jgi:uncharacterized protein YcbX
MAESAPGTVVGTVTEMWRYPVKSMQGERVEASTVTPRGLVGDRAYALVDVGTGRLASAKRPRQWGGLLHHAASLVDAGAEPPGVVVTLPDGTCLRAGPGADEALSESLGRPVRLVTAAPQGAALEEIWMEEKGESLYGPVVATEDDQAVIDVPPALGAPPGTLFDFSAVHLVTSSALEAVASALPAGVDVRRFRPNLVIGPGALGGAPPGFPENDWVGRTIRVGDEVTLEGLMLTMRCVMVTLAQPGLEPERAVMRAVAAVNRVEVPGLGTYPCAGLYARVTRAGTVTVGDEVSVH